MAKAMLVNAEMTMAESINVNFLSDNSNRPISEIHGPMRYTYHLEYTSFEPLSLSDFPREIDIGNDEVVVTSEIKVKKERVKEKQTRPPKVNNAIQQLQLTDN